MSDLSEQIPNGLRAIVAAAFKRAFFPELAGTGVAIDLGVGATQTCVVVRAPVAPLKIQQVDPYSRRVIKELSRD